jgi:hypothetical protein
MFKVHQVRSSIVRCAVVAAIAMSCVTACGGEQGVASGSDCTSVGRIYGKKCWFGGRREAVCGGDLKLGAYGRCIYGG